MRPVASPGAFGPRDGTESRRWMRSDRWRLPIEDFASVYARHFSRIHGYVRLRVPREEEAEDVTSAIFEAAFKKFGEYSAERGEVDSWLFGIARKEVSQYFRRQSIRRFIPLDLLPASEQARQEPGPEELAFQGATYQELRSLFRSLGAREQEVLALKFGGELTNREIARMTGLSESNVGTVAYRALQQLRRGMGT